MKRFALMMLVALVLSCGGKQEESSSASPQTAAMLKEALDLNKIIIMTPPALVSSTAHLDVEFREEVAPDHFSGTILDKSPFEFDPPIMGEAKWVTPKLLRFIPEGHLPPGLTIQATLKGKIALGQQKNVNDFSFSFKVAEQEVLSLDGDFAPLADGQKQLVYKAKLTFAQAVNLEEIKNDLAMKRNGRKVSLRLQIGENQRIIILESQPVIRADKGQNFTLSLPSKYTVQKKRWTRDIFLPPAQVFRVLAQMDVSDPRSDALSYGFRFSDPLKSGMDLSGYVLVEPAVNFDIQVSKKYLTLNGPFLPGQSYTVTLAKGLPSALGSALSREYTSEFTFNNIKPEVEWLSDGVYLPTANQYKLQFKSVNVKTLDIVVTEVHPQNIGFFLQRNIIEDRSKNNNNLYDAFSYDEINRVGEIIYDTKLDITERKNQWIKTELDLGSVFNGKENALFIVQLRFNMESLTGRPVQQRQELEEGDLYFEGDNYYNNPAQYGYYYSRGTLNKLLIASNVGLTLKKADEGWHVFATDVASARPKSGLSLSLFNYQNRKLETQTTDSDGHALFTQDGAYFLGDDNSGLAVIKTNHHAWQINNFDVSGSDGGQNGTNVFMYTDRGVHRPGDTVHFSAIVRLNSATPPEDQPVLFKVKNPRGQTVLDTKAPCGENGHVYFPIETEMSDPTGNWRAELTIGDQTFYKELKIETVKPNRLKIEVDTPDKITGNNPMVRGRITSRYLFGTPAAHLRATLNADFYGRPFETARFDAFTFQSPLRQYESRYHEMYDGELNEQGQGDFAYPVPGADQAPGLIQAALNTTVYEKGGGFTQQQKAVTVYPYTAFVGIKDVFEWGYAPIDEKASIPLVAVDPEGQPVAGHSLRVRVFLNRHHWWYDYDNHDRRDFREMTSTYLLSESKLTSGDAPVSFDLEVEDQGRHYIEVTDLETGHETGLFFYASRWGRMARTEEPERNTLQIASDKNFYNIGDRAMLTFDTPDEGMALLSVEQGSKILYRAWKPVESGQTAFQIDLTREMMPNCYASVSLIQPHNQNSNDMPMRIYGIKPLYVEDQSTRLPLSMTVTEKLEPKQPFTVSVTNSGRKTATVTIAVVDEGLLDLTGFETPDPWDHFFQKVRLGIVTRDNFDEILGVLFPDMDRYFSIGGGFDEAREKRLNQSKTKRFKPAVLFQQPVKIKGGRTLDAAFTMPNYVGSVRVMVVGAAGHSYAALEETRAVKQPLMVLPTIPRVARPGDAFSVPVSVFAMDSTVKSAAVSLAVSPNLTIDGIKETSVAFEKPGEKDIRFRVSTGDAIGQGKITVQGRSGTNASDYSVDLPIVSANPFYTDVTDTMIQRDQSVVFVPEKLGVAGTNAARLAFSRMPDIQLDKRYKHLIRYPYGCVEQTVSSVFPQLFLGALLDLRSFEKDAVTRHVNEAMQRLTRYQMNRGFSYWPLSSHHAGHYSDWGTSYAGHFLIEAKTLGYHVPPTLFDHWLEDARHRAKQVNSDNHRYQAYRLFLLALAGEPHAGAMNMLRESYLSKLDPLSRKLLAAAYYLSGQKAAADEVNRAISTEFNSPREMGGTYGSPTRDLALMTYLCLKMEDTETAARLLRQLGNRFTSQEWYSTQETAITLLAMGTYFKVSPYSGGSVKFHVNIEGRGTEKFRLDNYQTQIPLEDAWGKKVTVTTDNDNPLFVSLLVEGVPQESRIQTENRGISLTREFYDESGNAITIDSRKQGEPFWVIYTVQSRHGETIENLALSSIFPSGWEIINLRVTDEAPPAWVRRREINQGDFMDIRDDRINWFFNLRHNRLLRFGTKINPTFQGDFVLPPVVCEAMYSPEIFARIQGGVVAVE